MRHDFCCVRLLVHDTAGRRMQHGKLAVPCTIRTGATSASVMHIARDTCECSTIVTIALADRCCVLVSRH